MIIKTVGDFKQHMAAHRYKHKYAAVMKAAFMVSPVGFSLDQQTAQDNAYMQISQTVDVDLAIRQQINLARKISDCGVPVVSFPGSEETPDAVFPNNAFATTHGRRYIIGSMRYENRQKETQRQDIRDFFGAVLGYEKYEIDHDKAVAELTGVLVPDRAKGIGFVGMTERVDEAGVKELLQGFNLHMIFQFDLKPTEYHTNVVLAVLAGKACVVCADSFVEPAAADVIAEFYQNKAIMISEQEKQAFIGNCISITDRDIFFSQTAMHHLSTESIGKLEKWGFILHSVDVSELEKAGGSLRCMIGEIF